MHNTDRTQQYLESGPTHEYEYEFEGSGGEFESGGGEFEFESGGGGEFEFESGFSQETELELASELLGVTNEQELEQFIGNLFKKVARGVSNFGRSAIGKTIGGAIKGLAKQGLSTLGGVAGNFLLPGVGGAIGSKLGGLASNALGLELEGLSAEDREFEVARRIVRVGTTATRHALRAPQGASPMSVARAAMTHAARRHAPGLLRRRRRGGPGHGPGPGYGPGRGYGAAPGYAPTPDSVAACNCNGEPGVTGAPSGSWYRQGNAIVLEGV